MKRRAVLSMLPAAACAPRLSFAATMPAMVPAMSLKPSDALKVNKTHRIERQVVINEISTAGFQLAEETDLLANPKAPLTVPVFQQEPRGHTNQFVLKFRKA